MVRVVMHARRREAGWALLLGAVLSAGVFALLLLATATQQQSVRLTQQQKHVQQLQARAQALQTSLERAADPHLLARRAKRLHMHPATRPVWVKRSGHRHRK